MIDTSDKDNQKVDTDINRENTIPSAKELYKDETGKYFKKGNPGKPHGARNKEALLRDKIISYAQEIDLRTIDNEKVMELAARIMPKEQKIELNTEPIQIQVIHNYDPSKVQPETDDSLGNTTES